MSVDRPFVGGGKIEVAPGTCPACVWGDGPHTCDNAGVPLSAIRSFDVSCYRLLPPNPGYPKLRPESDESYEASQAILETRKL